MFSPSYVKNLVSTINLLTSVPGGSWCLATLKPVIEWGVAKYCGDDSNVSLIISKCNDVIIQEKLPSIANMLTKLDEKDWAVIDSLSSYAYEKSYITVQHLVGLIEVLYKIKDDLKENSLEFLKVVLDGAVTNEYAMKVINACDEAITQEVCPKLLNALSKLEKSELSALLSMKIGSGFVVAMNKVAHDLKGTYSENRESINLLLKTVFGVGKESLDSFVVYGDVEGMEIQALTKMQKDLKSDYPHFFEIVKDAALHPEISVEDLLVCG